MPPGTPGPQRGHRGDGDGRGHVPLIAWALVAWFILVWVGVAVLGDRPARSALMAGIVVALAVTWRLRGSMGSR